MQSVDDTLLKHPEFASLLVEYFETKFATDRKETPHERADKLLPVLTYKYEERLQRVTAIQEDLILRYFLDLLEATRRTNYYRPGRGDTISIKIESRARRAHAAPVPDVRDLRARTRRRGHPPARRQGRPRWSAPLGSRR